MEANTFETARRRGAHANPAPIAGSLRREGVPAGVATRSPGRRARPAAPSLCGFLPAIRGGVAVESAISLSVLVLLFAGLMAIAHSVYGDDRMGRAARSAARAVALEADASTKAAALAAIACKAIRSELDLEEDFDCSAWTLKVKADLTPSSLSSGTNAGDAGEMVLVEIEWKRAPWSQALSALDGSGKRIATGVARREPARPGA